MAYEQKNDDPNAGSGETSLEQGNNEDYSAESGDKANHESDDNNSSNDGIEERARAMGWVPEDEFRGDKSRWVDAESFVKRGDNELPIMRERNRAMEKRVIQLEKTLKKFSDHHKSVSEREYKKALAEVKAQKADAIERADKKAFIEAETMEEELKENKPKAIEEDDETDNNSDVHPDFPAWLSENPWYTTDKAASAYANAIAEELVQGGTTLKGAAFFNAIKAEVKKEFPHKFENKRRQQSAAVEGSNTEPAKPSGKKSYANLPPDAKAACDEFIKEGLMTKEQYLKEYEWS